MSFENTSPEDLNSQYSDGTLPANPLSELSVEFKWAARLALEGRVSCEDLIDKGAKTVLTELRDSGKL